MITLRSMGTVAFKGVFYAKRVGCVEFTEQFKLNKNKNLSISLVALFHFFLLQQL